MMKRWIAVLLAALLLASVTACSQEQKKEDENLPQQEQTQEPQDVQEDKPQEEDEPPVPAEPVYVRHAAFIPIEIDASFEPENVSSFCVSGSNIYFTVECRTEHEVIDDPLMEELYTYQNFKTLVFGMNPATKQIVHLAGYAPYEIPEGWIGYANLNSICPGADGTVWVNELVTTYRYNLPDGFSISEDDPSEYFEAGINMNRFLQLDASGNVLRELELTQTSDELFTSILADTNGYVYAGTRDTVQVYDPAGEYLGVVVQDYAGELIMLNQGLVGIRAWIAGSQISFLPIDPVNLTLGEPVVLNENGYDLVLGSNNYQYVYNKAGVLYGHTSGAETDERLFSLMDADVDSNLIDTCAFLSDGRLVTIEFADGTGADKFVLIDGEASSELPSKQILTLACLNISKSLRTDVVSFNRNNDDVRIVVKDYSEYNTDADHSVGLTQLKSELFAGQMPDILYVDPQLPVKQLASEGLLADLWTMIDQHEEIKREDLMAHFFDVLTTDGKLYQITDSFSIQTTVGLRDEIGDRDSWTLEELLQAHEDLGTDTSIFAASDTRADILNGCLSRTLNNFIDWKGQTAVCSFDSEEFAMQLEFANSFPETYAWSLGNTAMTENQRLRNGMQLLKQTTLSDFDQVRCDELELGEGQPVYAGYPTNSNNGSCFYTNGGFAISASCRDPQLAWRFVRTYLTESYQTSANGTGFPTNRHAFDAAAEKAMKPVEDGNELYWVGNMVYVMQPLTQEQYDAVWAVYEGCQSVAASDNEVLRMINEESAAFFNGEATAQETAAAVQKSVQNLLGA